MEVIE